MLFEAILFVAFCSGSPGKLIQTLSYIALGTQSAARFHIYSCSGEPLGTWVRTALAMKPGHGAATGALDILELFLGKHMASCSPPHPIPGAQSSSWNALMDLNRC